MLFTRRNFLTAALAISCADKARAARDIMDSEWVVGIIPDTPFNIDIVNIRKIPPAFRR